MEIDDPAARYIFQRPSVSDPKSETGANLVKRWMKHCEENHSEYQPLATGLPTHVLDVGTNGDVRLVHAKGQESKYACLSYCWGVAKQPVMLTTETYDSLSSNILLDSLPQTIKDAIFVTRAAVLQYLWIDALCIMQNDSPEAMAELLAMAEIYGKAALTISASCASSVNEGFLHPRPPCDSPDRQVPVALPYCCPDGTLGTIVSVSGVNSDITQEPIMKRAWTLQEQLLSPRLIVYCAESLVWECQTGKFPLHSLDIHMASGSSARQENLVRLRNAFFSLESEGNLFAEPLLSDVRMDWVALVQHYTRRSLTYQKDKFHAISALKSTFTKAFKEHAYICGMWMNHRLPGNDMLHQLLWYVPRPYTPQRVRDKENTVSPSWSLTSYDRRDAILADGEREADIYWALEHPWFVEDNANRALASVVDLTVTNINPQHPPTELSMLSELTLHTQLKKGTLTISCHDHISAANGVVHTLPVWNRRTPTKGLNCYLDTDVRGMVGKEYEVLLVRLVEGHGLVCKDVGSGMKWERMGVYREEQETGGGGGFGGGWVEEVEFWFIGAWWGDVVLV